MNQVEPSQTDDTQWSLAALVALSIGPGLLLLAVPELLRPLGGFGRTVGLSLYFLADAVLLTAILAVVARLKGVTFSSVVGYTRRLPTLSFLALVAVGAVWSIALRDFVSIPGLRQFSTWMMAQIPWWPSLYGRMPADDSYFSSAGLAAEIMLTSFATFALVVASIAQSIYFQGFLLSRMGRFGLAAPVLNNILFVVYHLGSPFFWPQFFLFTIIWAVIAYLTRNVWSQAWAHAAMNGYQGVTTLFNQLRGAA